MSCKNPQQFVDSTLLFLSSQSLGPDPPTRMNPDPNGSTSQANLLVDVIVGVRLIVTNNDDITVFIIVILVGIRRIFLFILGCI